MRIKLALWAGILVYITSSCSSENQKQEKLRTVKLETVCVYGEKRTVSFPGKVKAAEDVNLAFRVSGTIQRVYVTPGTSVKKNQILAEIDPRDYQIQLSATEAEFKQIKADAERVIELYNKKSVTPSEYEKAVYGLQQITAKHNAHMNALADTKLRAPFDGYVQKRFFDINETVGAGMPVVSIITTQDPEVEINIPSGSFIQRDKFESYSCKIDIYPDKVYPLDLIGITQKANLNQLYTMRLKIKNPDKNPMPAPGMATMVSIQYKSEKSDLYSIPLTALFENNGNHAVWVYDSASETVTAKTVRLREILTNGIVIISDGVNENDVVVSAGVHSLQEGQKVRRLEPTSSTNIGGLL